MTDKLYASAFAALCALHLAFVARGLVPVTAIGLGLA